MIKSPPKRLSYSGASTYHECPKKWHTTYIIGVRGENTMESERGTFVHLVLETLMAMPPSKRTLETAKRLARQLWDEFTTTTTHKGLSEVWQADDATWLTWRRDAWAAIVRAFTLEDLPAIKVVSVERDVEVALDGVPFKGLIDRVDEGPVVNDYKTGKIPAPRFQEPIERQIRLYAAGWKEMTGEAPVRAAGIYLKGGGKILDVTVDDWSLEDAVCWLKDQWRGIQADVSSGEYEAKPGPLCGWCPALPTCSEGQAAVMERIEKGSNVGPGAAVMTAVSAQEA